MQKRQVAESLISRVDELLPPYVFQRPSFCMTEEYPIVVTASTVVQEIEPVLESLERQLLDISAARESVRGIASELVALRSKK